MPGASGVWSLLAPEFMLIIVFGDVPGAKGLGPRIALKRGIGCHIGGVFDIV